MYSINLAKKTENTVGCDYTLIIVLNSNRVQLFPQSLLSFCTAERKEQDVTGGISTEKSG